MSLNLWLCLAIFQNIWKMNVFQRKQKLNVTSKKCKDINDYVNFRLFKVGLSPSKKFWKILYKTSDYWSRDLLNFNFSEKGLGRVSPPYFVFNFSRKIFAMLYPILTKHHFLTAFTSLRLYYFFLVVFFPGCEIINFKINLIFPIKPLLYITKKS